MTSCPSSKMNSLSFRSVCEALYKKRTSMIRSAQVRSDSYVNYVKNKSRPHVARIPPHSLLLKYNTQKWGFVTYLIGSEDIQFGHAGFDVFISVIAHLAQMQFAENYVDQQGEKKK